MPSPAVSDQEEPQLNPDLTRYITLLSEPISNYTRYFDALLIKRLQHHAFFRDLKAFRCQPYIIAILTAPTTPGTNTKDLYRQVSRSFLASRFAHPWCRRSQLKDGWFKAEWGSIKKQSEARQREEEKLHKLLVPIWCGFRVKMMPSEEVLGKWLENQRRKEHDRRPVQADAKVEDWLDAVGMEAGEELTADGASSGATATKNNLEVQPLKSEIHPVQSASFNAEAFVMEDDDYDAQPNFHKDDDAAAAAKLFVGVAATGFLASNKRARKYLMKKLNKKK